MEYKNQWVFGIIRSINIPLRTELIQIRLSIKSLSLQECYLVMDLSRIFLRTFRLLFAQVTAVIVIEDVTFM